MDEERNEPFQTPEDLGESALDAAEKSAAPGGGATRKARDRFPPGHKRIPDVAGDRPGSAGELAPELIHDVRGPEEETLGDEYEKIAEEHRRHQGQ